MGKTIHKSISLEEQPRITKFKVVPSMNYLKDNYLVTTGDYEQYSYTGNQTQVDAKYSSLVSQYNGSMSKKATLTRTRMNGNIWQLDVKIEDLIKQDPEQQAENMSSEQEASMGRKYGTKSNPRLKSVSVSTNQEDIFCHPKFDNVPIVNLSVIRMYQNGATENDLIPDPNDPTKFAKCGDYMHLSDDLCQMAIKYKTYLVPNISVTYTYFSKQQPAIDTEIPTFSSNLDGLKVPEGWQAMYCGGGSEATEEDKGFVVTQNYLIGKFPTELYKD